jgi:hypothetical protein
MTAINITLQPSHRCLHVVSDGASYNEAGIIVGTAAKVNCQPQWPGIISTRGNVVTSALVSEALASQFTTFDDAVAGIEAELPGIAADIGLTERNLQIFVAGWSLKRNCPEMYLIHTSAELPLGVTKEEVQALSAAGRFVPPPPFVLTKIESVIESPRLSLEMRKAASCSGIGISEVPDRCVARMHFVLVCQRHEVHCGKHFMGGFAQVTTITPDQITQRILERWPQDKVGQLIQPGVFDVHAWKSKHWRILDYDPELNPWGLDPETRERFQKQIAAAKVA